MSNEGDSHTLILQRHLSRSEYGTKLPASPVSVKHFCCWARNILGELGWYHDSLPWWRHQMETFSALLAICAGNWPVPGDFPAQRPVTRNFHVFFDLRLNKPLKIIVRLVIWDAIAHIMTSLQWPFASPCHQRGWYWIRRIHGPLYSSRKNSNYLCHLGIPKIIQRIKG